jgi:DNA-binding CsgD family transcriptional regulator/PAS domain-containing protein
MGNGFKMVWGGPQSTGVFSVQEAERLSALIGDIYDAALDPTLWVDVLGKIRAFIGGWSVALSWKDSVAKRGGSYFEEGGQDPYYRQLYFEKYIKLDPFSTTQFVVEIEEPKSFLEVMPYAELIQTRLYREWAQPQGIVDALMCLIDRSATSVGFLVVFRNKRDGFVDDETRQRARLVIPHIRRATLIGKVIDLKKAEAASLADTLDGISAGMFLVDATGRIVHANAAGQMMLQGASVLHAELGRLIANDPLARRTLAETFATAGNGDAAVGIKGIAVPLVARDGERYVAHVLPLTSGARRQAGASYAAVAALFVHKAALDTPSPPEAIAKAYKLTPMELRVLLAIVEVGGVPEVAEAFGVAETTVRTHLHQTYQKTGVNRQADLVKLVAGFSNPLLD